MKIDRLNFLVLLFGATVLCRADYRITAILTITNAPPTNGSTLVVNGFTRTWSTNVTAPATQIPTSPDLTIAGATTNLALHLQSYPIQFVTAWLANSNQVRLDAQTGRALSVSGSGNWFSVSYSTQAVVIATNVIVPPEAMPSGARASVANALVSWLYLATNPLPGSIAGFQTNAITTNSPSGVTNVVSSLARSALNNATVTNLANVEPSTGKVAYWDDQDFTVQGNLKTLGWFSFADFIAGDGFGLTNLNATNLTGFVQSSNLGAFASQNVGARYLRNDYTWQIIPGGGDMLAANNLADVASVGLARTNLGVHNASNITAGVVHPARLATNSPDVNLFLQATSPNTARWVATMGGSGDMLAANNLSDVASIGQSRTNLGANNAANITEGILAAERLQAFNMLTGATLRVTSQAILTNAILRGTTQILDPFDASNATNLVHGPIVTNGDGTIQVTAVTNTTTAQRSYYLALSQAVLTNVFHTNSSGLPPKLIVSALTGCAEDFAPVSLERVGWGRWESVNSNPPVHIEIYCVGESCQWQLWASCGGSSVVYTNASFENPYPLEPAPPEGFWAYAGDGLGPASVAWLAGQGVEAQNGIVSELLRFKFGFIIPSNSWQFLNTSILREGDVWLGSSNGILHSVHKLNGVLSTNRLVP